MIVPRTVPSGTWGCDTIYVFDDASAARLRAASTPGGNLAFIWRYFSDVSQAELQSLLRAGWIVLPVDHVMLPSWIASASLGTQRATAFIHKVLNLGYPQGAGCHVAVDMEGLGNPGPDDEAYVRAWAAVAHAAGYLVCYYQGYDDGLTDAVRAQLVREGVIDVIWSDFGPRAPLPGIGFACKQRPQTTLAGIGIDYDVARADDQGRSLCGCAWEPDVNVETEDPANANIARPT